jgi:hypothetical protein
MKFVVAFFRYLLIIFLAGLIAQMFNAELVTVFKAFYPFSYSGLDMDFTGITVFVFSFELFVSFLIAAAGDKIRFWILGVTGILVLLPFALSHDRYLYIDVSLLLLGTLLGVAVRTLASKTLGETPQFAQYKKYF